MHFSCPIRHLSEQSCQNLFLDMSHRDDLVFVDPQQISHNDILPLLCAETETHHGQLNISYHDIHQFGSRQHWGNSNCVLECFRGEKSMLDSINLDPELLLKTPCGESATQRLNPRGLALLYLLILF